MANWPTGTRLRCIDAKEAGIPLTEGETYTCSWHGSYASRHGPPEIDRGCKAVEVVEVEGIYMETRFERTPS